MIWNYTSATKTLVVSTLVKVHFMSCDQISNVYYFFKHRHFVPTFRFRFVWKINYVNFHLYLFRVLEYLFFTLIQKMFSWTNQKWKFDWANRIFDWPNKIFFWIKQILHLLKYLVGATILFSKCRITLYYLVKIVLKM